MSSSEALFTLKRKQMTGMWNSTDSYGIFFIPNMHRYCPATDATGWLFCLFRDFNNMSAQPTRVCLFVYEKMLQGIFQNFVLNFSFILIFARCLAVDNLCDHTVVGDF